ncbi:MAG: lipoprotein-releasing ABC transporter permease subunit [Deltaproteobacteria bacterium]|nr:lipoprotein-releasing ABC transporter permease subunit [Deltaproteobacteria bacterium]
MLSRYEIFIALRYLRAKRKQMFVSVVTFFSIAGIAIGVAALIVVLSVMNGFREELTEKVINTNSHVVCMRYDGGIKNYADAMKRIGTIDGVIATAPVVYGQAMIRNRSGISGLMVRGIELKEALKVINVGKIKKGTLAELKITARNSQFPAKSANLPGIAIGKELARNAGVSLYDSVTLVSPEGISTPFGTVPSAKNFVVVAIFESGFYEYDTAVAYLDIEEAKSFFGLGSAVSAVEIRVSDIYRAMTVAREIEKILPLPFFTRHWMEMNKSLFAALNTEKAVMFIILSLIIIVAAFNIITSLIMVVMEKSRDIAILKSIGATAQSITRIFVLQGLIIGSSGLALGCGLGLLVAGNINTAAKLLEKLFGIEVFPGDIYYFSQIPAKIALNDLLIIIIGTMVICLLATIYPSRRAAKLDPVEALRNE